MTIQVMTYYGGADNPYEAIKVIEAWEVTFNIGNVLKYLCRAGKKPGVTRLEDLCKARDYLQREIDAVDRATVRVQTQAESA
jgi:hypothetical protein